MSYVIFITGSSSGFGAMTARALADAGHTVYASMRGTEDRNADAVANVRQYADDRDVDLRIVELDVTDDDSVKAAIEHVLDESGRLDVLVHNAGHMAFGPCEAFTTEQLAALYDVNVLGIQRLNRAALPHMREVGRGLVVWVSSSSARGGVPPYIGPYFAAKAAMDSLAVTYAGELARWGVETAIVVPGAFTSGTNHFAHAGGPDDKARAKEYAEGPYKELPDQLMAGLETLEPDDADPSAVARAIVEVVSAPFGKRPFRVTVDPSDDGAKVVNMMADRVRAELLRRIGLEDLLHPTSRS